MPDPKPPGLNPSAPKKLTDGRTEDQDRGDRAARNPRPPRGKASGSAIPNAEDCLQALARMPGLVALGILKPAQASAIRGCYADILAYHRGRAKEAEKGLSNDDVRGLLRENPELLSLLEPLLTSEQVEMLMKDAGDGGHGKT